MMGREFWEYLREKRKESGISGRELSKRSGLSQGYISQIETGKHKTPKKEAVIELSEALNLPIDECLKMAGYHAESTEEVFDDENEDIESFGETIKKIRKEKGLTLRDLAKLSNVSQAYISQIETAKRKPKSSVLRKISRGLNVSYIYLMIESKQITHDDINKYLRDYIMLNDLLGESDKPAESFIDFG